VLKARVREAALERRQTQAAGVKQARQQRLRLMQPKPVRAPRPSGN
jgi:hypothetical protein